MPTLFTMPFLARLTSDNNHNSHASEGPKEEAKSSRNHVGNSADRNNSSASNSNSNNGSKIGRKRPHEPRAFEESQDLRKEAKKPRLGTHVLSSRPKLFANGLLSPIKGITTSVTSVSDRAPGRVPAPARTAGAAGTGPANTTAVVPAAAAIAAAATTTDGTRATKPVAALSQPGKAATRFKSTATPSSTRSKASSSSSTALNTIKAAFARQNKHATALNIKSRDTIASDSPALPYLPDTPPPQPSHPPPPTHHPLSPVADVVTAPYPNSPSNPLVPAPSSLQSPQNKAEDKRSLRSHDGGTRARSELAQYFPNWDEIIADEPLPQEPITHKTRLQILDEPIKAPSTPSRSRQVILPAPPTPCTPAALAPFASPSGSRGRTATVPVASDVPVAVQPPPSKIAGPPAEQSFIRISFASLISNLPQHPRDDPLSEEHYRPAHQRGERQEKQLRNIEKEKAQHEKVQLERLYEGLLGRDWLRQMGISGVTDGEKRDKWEVKRDYVISEVKAMLDKFERYREEEKRLKLEKEASMREEEDEDEDEEEEGEEVGSDEEEPEEEEKKKRRRGMNEVPDSEADVSGPEQGEAEHRKRQRRMTIKVSTKTTARQKGGKRARRPADNVASPTTATGDEEQAAAAANQLISETLSHTQPGIDPVPGAPGTPNTIKHRRMISTSSRTGIDVTPQVLYAPAGSEKPFTSFFSKPHLRAAALAGHRRGRAKFAFGQPIPEMEERDFSLPDGWITEDSRRDAARLGRMRRRSRKMDDK